MAIIQSILLDMLSGGLQNKPSKSGVPLSGMSGQKNIPAAKPPLLVSFI